LVVLVVVALGVGRSVAYLEQRNATTTNGSLGLEDKFCPVPLQTILSLRLKVFASSYSMFMSYTAKLGARRGKT
jgi:hypothetical protein